MMYVWLKALHVVAVITFVGGLLAVAVVLDVLRGPDDVLAGELPVPSPAAARARR